MSGADGANGGAPVGVPTGMTGYLAAEGYLDELLEEVGPAAEVHGRLALVPGPARRAAWAANIWHEPLRIAAPSVGKAAQALRALQRNWALYSSGHHRRAALIQEKLPKVSAKKLVFPAPAPAAPLGSWTLIDATMLLAAQRCSSPFPNGEAAFVEDKSGPPNRAYLKLWEALTLLGRHPGPGESCLDLGASPGGWTWALQRLGAHVLAVDKAPLAPAVAALPNVRFMKASAFALAPADIEPVDWLVSDVVCYPDRLLGLVETWLASGRARNMVCTVKFQGATDMAAVRRFAALPGARLLHLHHNKHELTWLWPA
ncbi:MAG TPA: SAM-dependent methyltransferase [Alphaproteobacteria bacterium]|jgi:23S rRNA (cytidine2498-2'-O)-methyltransferase|nr:SAM-dependent methyltransferase [Alphaproteobacteria bacterium]